MTAVLDSLNFPCLDSDKVAALNWAIELEEIQVAISSTQSGKTPGSDGFTAEFFFFNLEISFLQFS